MTFERGLRSWPSGRYLQRETCSQALLIALGDPLSIGAVTQPASGSVVIEANNSLTYTPSEPGELLKPQYVLEQLRDAPSTPDDTMPII